MSKPRFTLVQLSAKERLHSGIHCADCYNSNNEWNPSARWSIEGRHVCLHHVLALLGEFLQLPEGS